ncbi:hypothetical protein BC831DRAFT_401143 [Entophlyctis helioformis]|nr:hypothetical protein BC831DRAFT_401143 [Entophlyctis helioformis]
MTELEDKAQALLDQALEAKMLIEQVADTPLQDKLKDMDPLEKARWLTTVAYSICSLTFVYLRTVGVSPKTHPVKAELDRIKTAFTKIEKLSGGMQPTMRIDQKAAKRFVNHTLAANPETKGGAVCLDPAGAAATR